MSSDLIPTRQASTSSSLAAKIQAHKRSVGTFLLLDCSGSMSYKINTRERAIDQVRATARALRHESPTLRQIVFPDGEAAAREIQSDIPEPNGTTPLDEAITLASSLGAVHLIIVSDGEPNDPPYVKHVAALARCRIDVVFIGDAGSIGERFLRELASLHGGSCDTVDLSTKQLETKIRGLLTA